MQSPAIIALLLLILPCLCGCTGPSEAQQTALLAAQQAAANTRSDGRQLFYIGLALFPEQWSENDVVDLGNLLQKNHRVHVVQLIASNSASEPRRYPVADDRAIAALVRAAAEHAGSEDIVFVHISTHGNRGSLASQLGRGPPRMITAAQLASQFAPLDRQANVIIISACYSGSLIPSLQAPSRVIITASRADRNSFGCSPSNRHTYFGEAELQAFDESGHSLQQVVEDLRDTVTSMEHQKRLTPSEPQVSVGSNVGELYAAKLF
jgi:Peptidase C13 family